MVGVQDKHLSSTLFGQNSLIFKFQVTIALVFFLFTVELENGIEALIQFITYVSLHTHPGIMGKSSWHTSHIYSMCTQHLVLA